MQPAYSIGTSALNVGQRAIDLIGQNIANATTPGYSRQRPTIVNKVVGETQSGGVSINRIERYAMPALRQSVLGSNSEAGKLSSRLDVERQAEALFASGPGSVDGRMEQFFNQVERLASRPEDAAQRRTTVDAGVALASRFNDLSGDLTELRDSVFREAGTTVTAVNDLSSKIAELNSRISRIEAGGREQANDLRDQRDLLVNDLSKLVDVRVTEQESGVINVIGANAPLVVGDLQTKLEVTSNPAGDLIVRAQNTTTPLKVNGGKLSGLLEEHNSTLLSYRDRLDELANKLIETVNAIQSTGLPASGPLAASNGTIAVVDPTQPLNTQNLPFPIQAGELRISVTDTTTGTRTLQTVNIDPTTQSLNDVAAAITTATGGQVAGSVDPSGVLRFTAASGFAFDFAGQLPSSPNAVAMNGTSVPTLSGTYSGADNDTFNFQVIGSGTIGTTAGLTLEVRDSANSIIASLNIGDGYTPGSPLLVAEGVTVRLGAGTTNAGTFNVPVTADADTANILPALGVNGLFTGSDAGSIAVRNDIVADPTRLAGSRSGEPGETSNLSRMSELRDQKVLGTGTQNFREFFGDLLGTVGTEASSLNVLQTAQVSLQRNLEAQEQSVVGVDINEEMVNLLNFQRMVESASRYLTVVNRALDAVIDIVQ